MALIHAAMISVMKEIVAISKSKVNVQQKFKYRGIDDVYNAVQPLLAKHGVVVLPEVVNSLREERQSKGGGNLIYTHLTVKYRYVAEDGSELSCCVPGEGMDSGDKSSNKAMAVAHKYAILQTFCIPTDDMVDPDSESHTVESRATKQQAAPKQQTETPQTFAELSQELIDIDHIDGLVAWWTNNQSGIQALPEPQRSTIVRMKDEKKNMLTAQK